MSAYPALQSWRRLARLTVAWALPALLATSAGAFAQDLACAPDRVIFLTSQGAKSVTVEVADDPDERAQGLMFRKELAPDHGMIFIYETPRPASFWMRNTLIPLDMIFLDARGVIRHIHANAKPHDETPVPGNLPGDPDPDRLYVVELAGGEAARLGLEAGQLMAYPHIAKTLAAAPCR